MNLQRRLLLATMSVTTIGILVFGIPLAVVGRQAAVHDEVSRLDRRADNVGFVVDGDLAAGRELDPASLGRAAGPGRLVVVALVDGRRYESGTIAHGGLIHTEITTGTGTRVTIVASSHDLDERIAAALAVITGLALLGLLSAAVIATLLARRIARPLRRLATTSARLGAGDFSARAERSPIAETDAIAGALNTSAVRIEALVRRERELSANASHQLRTPLTALRLHLEELADTQDRAARTSATAALGHADQLAATIDDLLDRAPRRESTGSAAPLLPALRNLTERWSTELGRSHRHLRADLPDHLEDVWSAGAVVQAVDVLVDNAARHGGGEVTLVVRSHPGGRHVEISVSDDGPGIPLGAERSIFDRHTSLRGGTGIGLALARSLVQADGGDLTLVAPRPATFRMLVPASHHYEQHLRPGDPPSVRRPIGTGPSPLP